METRVAYMTWQEFDRRRSGTRSVVVPSGAVEVYGPHLPLGTDIIVAKKLADLVARRSGALTAPCLEIGNSLPLASFPGTLCCRPESLKEVYRDLCRSFMRWGFRSFLVVNTHRNNAFPLDDLLLELQSEHDIVCAAVHWWQYLPAISADVFTTPNPQNHASEAATSVMLHLAPELVAAEKACRAESRIEPAFPNIVQYIPYDRLTDVGMLGDALAGTAEKGRVVVERGVAEMAAYIAHVEKNAPWEKRTPPE